MITRNNMPPKHSPTHPTTGFVAKKDDFPSLSPSLGGGGGALAERTSHLEEFTSELSRGQSALVEGHPDHVADSSGRGAGGQHAIYLQ